MAAVPGAAPAPPPDPPADPGPTRAVLAGRVRRYLQAVAARLATEIRSLPFGSARLSPDLPLVFHMSELEVTRPAAPAEVLAVVGRIAAEGRLTSRRVTTAAPEVALSLGPALADRGWEVQRVVHMVHDGTAPPVSPLGFRAVGLDRWAPAARRFVADEPWGRDPAVQEQMALRDGRLADRMDVRFVLADDGRAGCLVTRHGRTAEVDAVHVLADARGEGLGQGLMAAALAECDGADLVCLVADVDDWPARWYRRLGYRPVASAWTFSAPA